MPQIKATKYKEPINLAKLKHIVNNPKLYKNRIEKEDTDRKKSNGGKHYDNTFTMLEKLVKNCEVPPEYKGTEMGILNVSYMKGRNSQNMGRFYCKDGIGIQALVNCVRHTICEGIWTDIDMINAHPVILQQLLKKYNLNSSMLDECVNDRERFLAKVNNDRASAKRKIISVINGASYPNHRFLHQFSNEVRPLITKIVYDDDWKDTTDYVRKTYDILGESKVIDKSISRILQVIENDLLENYLNWAYYKKNIIDYTTNYVALIFDGFQVLSKFNITDDDLEECRLYALEKTGYDIQLKIKPFDNIIELPDDYANTLEVRAELVHKYISNISTIIKDNRGRIENIIHNGGTHSSIAELAHKIFGGDFYYDDKQKKWYYYDYSNIWCETDDTDILRYLIQTIIKAILYEYAYVVIQEDIDYLVDNEKNENITDEKKKDNQETKKRLEEKQLKCSKSSKEIQNWSFVSKVCENARVFFNKSDFYKNYIDSKSYLFAFKNKVYDFRKNEVRLIKPDDYIMNTCGYNYPENIREEDTAFVINYVKTLFNDEDMFDYILDSFCSTLNGEKSEQYFNIHTGCGANGKTTLTGLFQVSLGGYAENIGSATFTKPAKGANDTGELWKAKGKRGIFTNEPDEGDKLQTSIMKLIADDDGQTIKARGLYKEAIEFNITFQLNMCCNIKPELSSVDGGIGRRVRVIDWVKKFVENPDPNNPNEILIDPNMIKKIKTPEIRDAFIILLLDRWKNRVSKMPRFPVPQKIKDASASYVADSNPVLGFVMSCLDITNNDKDYILSNNLYNMFNNKNITISRFKNDLLALGIVSKRKNSGMAYMGIKVKVNVEGESDTD
jgi:P4 family phage/plasmid primase-like protien